MRIAHVNQDPGISPSRKKGAAIHLDAMRRAFADLGAEVLPVDAADSRGVRAALDTVLEAGPVDALVCSLCLHHVAGWDGGERREHGLEGPGKLEVLARFARWLSPAGGLGLLNEADVHCDLSLAPGTAALRNNLFESYVWRCARAVLADIRTRTAADDEKLAVFAKISAVSVRAPFPFILAESQSSSLCLIPSTVHICEFSKT